MIYRHRLGIDTHRHGGGGPEKLLVAVLVLHRVVSATICFVRSSSDPIQVPVEASFRAKVRRDVAQTDRLNDFKVSVPNWYANP